MFEFLRKNWWMVGVMATVISLTATGVMWANSSFETMLDEVQISRLDVVKLLDAHSTAVQSELSGQTRQLENIAAKQREDIELINGRFEELEVQHGLRSHEHSGLMRDVYSVLGDFHFGLGKHEARHDMGSGLDE